MQLLLDSALSVIKIQFNDGTELSFEASPWNRQKLSHKFIAHDLDSEIEPNIFEGINAFLETLTRTETATLKTVYENAIDIVEEDFSNIIMLDSKLNNLITIIFEVIEWERFKSWCIEYGNFNTQIGFKETLDETDRAETTYFTEDYKNLIYFSIMIKLIMPIWGIYYTSTVNLLGKENVLVNAVELIRNPITESNPAYIRLYNHVLNFIEKDVKNSAYTITSQLGDDDLQDFLFSIAVWKKVVTFNPRAASENIVRNIHNIMKERCNRLSTAGPVQHVTVREDKRGGDGDKSIAESFAGTQRTPLAITPLVEDTLLKDDLVLKVDPTTDLGLVRFYQSRMPDVLPIKHYHLPICALVLKSAIGIKTVQYVRRKAMMSGIVSTAALLDHWGFKLIAEIITSTPIEKNLSLIGNQFIQIPPTKEQKQELAKIYSWVSSTEDNNPGLSLVEKIVQECLCNEYQLIDGKLQTLTNDLINLIIRQN